MRKSKKLAVLAGMLASVLAAGVAFAYWTASGTGDGTASVGSDDGVTITGIVFSGDLYPSGTVGVAFDVNNSSLNSPVKVGDVVADEGTPDPTTHVVPWPNGISVDPTHAAADGSHPGCDPTWFTYSSTTLNQEIAKSPDATHLSKYSAPSGSGLGNGGTLHMSDELSTNQDQCKGATLTLHLKTDNSGI